MNPYVTKRTGTGATFQAGIPFGDPSDGLDAPFLLRGVVMRVRVYDDPQHPYAANSPAAIFCDCLIYTQVAGGRYYWVNNCVVKQDGGGVHKGHVWIPRASKQSVSATAIDPTQPPNVSLLDGDHVLIGFIDNRRHLPVILGSLPHPSADKGSQDQAIGKRLRLRQADGAPDFSKYNGSFRGVDVSGNHIIDTTSGNTGAIDANGLEVPGVPGINGNQVNTAPTGGYIQHILVDPAGVQHIKHELTQSALNVTFQGSNGAVNIVNAAGPLVGVTIGASGGNVVLGNGTNLLVDNVKLVQFIQSQIAAVFATHTHGVIGNVTTPPTTGPMGPATTASFANNSVRVPTS